MANILLEVTLRDRQTPPNPVTIRMSHRSAIVGTQLNGYQWLPLITSLPTMDCSWTANGYVAPYSSSYGSVDFIVSTLTENTDWSGLEWQGALARIFLQTGAEDDWSSYKQIWEGSTTGLARKGSIATIGLLGAEATLDIDTLNLAYAGTGGAEGPTALKGTLKPRAFGSCQCVAPVLVDKAYEIYQVHGYGLVSSIKVYEFALELDPAANKGDTSGYLELKNMTLAAGEWATCRAQGLFRLGAAPTKKLSADVVVGGDTVADILGQLLDVAAVPAGKRGSFAAFASTKYSLFLTSQTSVGEAARQMLADAGGALFPDSQGRWQVMDYYAPATPLALNQDRSSDPLVTEVGEPNAAPPIYKVRVGFDRNWNVHSPSDVSPLLLDESAALDAAEAAQEAADNALATANAAKLVIDAVVDDGKLDRAEKAQLVQLFTVEAQQQTGLQQLAATVEVTTEKQALDDAFQAWKSYLEGLSPSYTDTSVDTPIDRTVFRDKAVAYYAAKQALLNRVADAAWSKAVQADDRARQSESRLDNIASDNILSAGEKSQVQQEFDKATSEKNEVINAGNVRGLYTGAVSSTFSDLQSYLNGLSLSNGQDTPITGTEFRKKFSDFWGASVALWRAIDGQAVARENETFRQLGVISSDGYLSRGEKPTVIREADQFEQAYTQVKADAVKRTVDTQGLDIARGNLYSYLNSVQYTNTSVDTDLSGNPAGLVNAFRGAWQSLGQARLDISTNDFDRQQSSMDRLKSIGVDDILSRDEKYQFVGEWQKLNKTFDPWNVVYIQLGSPSALTSYQGNAYSSISNVSAAFPSGWFDSSYDSPMGSGGGSTIQNRYAAAYEAVNAFAARIAVYQSAGGNTGGGSTPTTLYETNVSSKLIYSIGETCVDASVSFPGSSVRITLTPYSLYGANNNTAAATVEAAARVNGNQVGSGNMYFNGDGSAASGAIVINTSIGAGQQSFQVVCYVRSGADGPISFRALVERV